MVCGQAPGRFWVGSHSASRGVTCHGESRGESWAVWALFRVPVFFKTKLKRPRIFNSGAVHLGRKLSNTHKKH